MPRSPISRSRKLPTLLLAGLLGAWRPMMATDSAAQPAASALPAAQAQTVLTKVQSFYDKTTSFTSDFTQEFFVKSHNVKKQSKGKVTFAKPGKMHWGGRRL